jgi:hypothetical protein
MKMSSIKKEIKKILMEKDKKWESFYKKQLRRTAKKISVQRNKRKIEKREWTSEMKNKFGHDLFLRIEKNRKEFEYVD